MKHHEKHFLLRYFFILCFCLKSIMYMIRDLSVVPNMLSMPIAQTYLLNRLCQDYITRFDSNVAHHYSIPLSWALWCLKFYITYYYNPTYTRLFEKGGCEFTELIRGCFNFRYGLWRFVLGVRYKNIGFFNFLFVLGQLC